MKNSTKKLVLAALFVALSFVGANIKVMSSIAFDSLPAFLGTLVLGGGWGAAIGAVGHLLTALTSGFPYTLPAHLVIAVMMALAMVVFLSLINLCQRFRLPEIVSYVVGGVAAVLVNGPVAVLLLFPLLGPAMGSAALLALIPVLSLVAGINVALAVVIYRLLPRSIRRKGKVYNDAQRDNH